MNIDVETRCELARYLSLIRQRSNGKLWTAAKWIRELVKGHEVYQQDSVVGEQINHDLIGAVIAIEQGKKPKHLKDFLGNFLVDGCRENGAATE
jgi:glutamate--cysteine ligase catalytic subunit